jgi:hypothetical protein
MACPMYPPYVYENSAYAQSQERPRRMHYMIAGQHPKHGLVYLETRKGWNLYRASSYDIAFMLARYFGSNSEAKRAKDRASRLHPSCELSVIEVGESYR